MNTEIRVRTLEDAATTLFLMAGRLDDWSSDDIRLSLEKARGQVDDVLKLYPREEKATEAGAEEPATEPAPRKRAPRKVAAATGTPVGTVTATVPPEAPQKAPRAPRGRK